ncbi:MAG: TetR/AcrR family transcriptional regulator [Actinomycetota bacterium]|nr:TetR/AcrR family transcriptional regulator [Actinomycetota bacterium]
MPVETGGVGGRRRQPQQRRSRERFERVIAATKELVAELGPEPVTTAVIAERAGVSVAWIYRYFEDRQDIFDVIVLDAVHRIWERTQQAVVAASSRGWRAALLDVLDENAAFYAEEPAFVRLWCSDFRSQAMLAANRLHDDDQAQWLYASMTRLGVLEPGTAAESACRLVVAVADRGLELAFSRDDRGDRLVIDQLGRALTALLEPYCEAEPAPTRR